MHDLSQYNVVKAAQKGTDHTIIAPDGVETPVVVKIMGLDAPEVVRAIREFDKQHAKKGEDLHPDDLDLLRKAVMVTAAVRDWGGLSLDGTEVDPSNAQDFLSSLDYGWITNQLFAKARLRSNFFTKEPKD